MHETQESTRPPIASLRGYWAVVLPLLGLAAQFALGLLLGFVFAAGGLTRERSPLMIIVIVAGFSALAYLIIVRILLARRGWHWRDLGLAESPNAPVLAAIAIGLVTCVLASLFDRAVQPGPSMFGNMSSIEFLAAGLVIGILVPFGEEVLFRGIVFPVLRARFGNTAAAVLVSALIFGAFHLYPLQIVVGFFLGLPLAGLRHWSGSLLPPIALHMTHNLGVVLLAAWKIL